MEKVSKRKYKKQQKAKYKARKAEYRNRDNSGGIENIRRKYYENGLEKTKIGHFFQTGGTLDSVVVLLVLVIFLIGYAMMCSVQYALLAPKAMLRQAIFGAIGIFLMFFISRIDYQILNSYVAFGIFGFVFAGNAYYAIKAMVGGNINRGGFFQPSELLKCAVIIFLSYMICAWNRPLMAKKKYKRAVVSRPTLVNGQLWIERIIINLGVTSNIATLLLIGFAAIACLSVLLQSHLSGTIIVFLISMVILAVGGADRKWVIIVGVVAVAGVTFAILFPEVIGKVFKQYMAERIIIWREHLTVAECAARGYGSDRTQVEASLKAIGSGGWFGLGYGNSIMKYSYLAEAKTDFIFAVVVEELGYIPSMLILGLFAALFLRCMKIARTTIDKFGALLVVGIASQVMIEVLLNVMVVTDTIPNTGITFPFFSYGGSALVMLFVEMGIILSVARGSKATIDSADKLVKSKEVEDTEEEE